MVDTVRRHWHAFHNGWAASIAAELNTRLPDGYFAEPNVQSGIEIDVAAFGETTGAGARPTAESPPPWNPPPPSLTLPLPMLTDLVEVAVYITDAGPVLAGAIELVSPANKGRASHREAFLAKWRSHL